MADEIDRANDHVINITEDALASVRGLVPQENPDIHEDGECECGESIPYKRLRLGFDTCVQCAAFAERNSKMYGHKSARYDYDE